MTGKEPMKELLVAVAGCVLLASSSPAWAQPAQYGRGPNPYGGYARGGWRGGDDDGDPDDRRSYRRLDHSRGGGAQFWLRSGDTRLGVRCDPNEPMRACLDAAMTLLDKARSMPSGTAPPTPASN